MSLIQSIHIRETIEQLCLRALMGASLCVSLSLSSIERQLDMFTAALSLEDRNRYCLWSVFTGHSRFVLGAIHFHRIKWRNKSIARPMMRTSQVDIHFLEIDCSFWLDEQGQVEKYLYSMEQLLPREKKNGLYFRIFIHSITIHRKTTRLAKRKLVDKIRRERMKKTTKWNTKHLWLLWCVSWTDCWYFGKEEGIIATVQDSFGFHPSSSSLHYSDQELCSTERMWFARTNPRENAPLLLYSLAVRRCYRYFPWWGTIEGFQGHERVNVLRLSRKSADRSLNRSRG